MKRDAFDSEDLAQAETRPPTVGPAAGSGSVWQHLPAKLTVFATAAAFLLGWLYRVGFLGAFELPLELFPQEGHDILMNVYLAAFGLLDFALVALNSRPLLITISTLALVAGLAVAASVAWRNRLSPHLSRIKSWEAALLRMLRRPHVEGIFSGLLVGITALAAPYIVLLSTLLALTLPLLAHRAGQLQAGELLSRVGCTGSQGVLYNDCADVTFADGSHVVGLYVVANDKAIALRSGHQTVVYYRERQSINFGTQKRPAGKPTRAG